MDWITPALISGALLASSAIIGLALINHTNASERHLAQRQPLPKINEDTWREVIEQIVTDITGEEVYINAFSQMTPGQNASMRFVGRDSRVYVFAICPRLADCQGRGRDIETYAGMLANRELHLMWQYLMRSTEQAGPVPRRAQWHLLPPQVPQQAVVLRPKISSPIQYHEARWRGLRHLLARAQSLIP